MRDRLFELVGLQLADLPSLQLNATGAFVLMAMLEARFAEVQCAARSRELLIDLWYWLTVPVVRTAGRLVVIAALAVCALPLGMGLGPDVLQQGFGPVAQQPKLLLWIEAALLIDLTSYWSHRLLHTVPVLWRFHAIHHSAKVVRWSTTGRLHPVNDILNYLAAIGPCVLLGFPLDVVLSLVPVLSMYAIAAHAEWNPTFGKLGSVLASPRFHRWHHTLSHEGGNSNFGNVFSIWDRLFGTAYLPAGRVPEVFGLDHDDMPDGYLAQLAYPFRSGARTRARECGPARDSGLRTIAPDDLPNPNA